MSRKPFRTEDGKIAWEQTDEAVPIPRTGHRMDHYWHVAVNAYTQEHGHDGAHFMYEAKDAASEVGRLQLLFSKERAGTLTKIHRQCSHSEPVEVPDNHLTCCLGTKCASCPFLLAIEATEDLTDAEKDQAKAWTCVTHIISEGGDRAREGYVLTVDDRMFWDTTYMYMSMAPPSDEEQR